MGVVADPSLLSSLNREELAVHLQTRDTEDDLDTRLGESMRHFDIGLLVESGRQLDDRRDTLTVMQRVDQRLCDSGVLGGPIQANFDGRDVGVERRCLQHINDVVKRVIGEVQQHVPLANDIENARRIINLGNIDRRMGSIFQSLAPRIREGKKILGIVVPATRNHAVVTAESKTFPQSTQQRFRHRSVVYKTHRICLASLLQTRRHLFNKALVDGGVEFQLRVSGELKAIGPHRRDVEYTSEDLRQTGTDDVIQGDIHGAFATALLSGYFNKAPQLLRGHLQHRKFLPLTAFDHDREIQRFVSEVGYRQRLVQQNRL